MITIIAIAALIATFLGGLFALKLRDKLHLILGFSAGAVIAVAFFDLLPESLDLSSGFYSNSVILAIAALGFIVYLILDRLVFLHAHAHVEHEAGHGEHHDDDHCHDCPQDAEVEKTLKGGGILGAASLSVHSFLDGIAIGLAFQVSAAVGIIVAIAVLVHDFSDGINTVNMILKNKGARGQALRWLTADAVAPVLGIVATFFFTVPVQGLAIVLALFSGFFLYIGASDLIPESHHAHPKFMTTAMTVLGAVVLYIAIHFANI
jgi:ZIP family zinc transporter